MARLPFKTAFLFGSNAPSNAISKFGSNAAGSPSYSSPPDPAVIQALSQWEGGWTSPSGAVTGTNQPAIEDVMAKDYVDSYFVNYLQQIGIVEFDVSGQTPYDRYSWVNGGLTTSDYQLYVSKQNSNTQPLSNTNAWGKLGSVITGPAVAAAWVVFNGSTAAISGSFNVSGIVQNSTGNYTVTFGQSLSTATPAMLGTCQGIVRPITPGASSFTFDTAGILSGSVFQPLQFGYVSVMFLQTP